MGYKIGFILSLLLIVELFILGGDMFTAQVIYTNLDAVSITAGNIISTKGGITQEVVNLVKNETGGTIEPVGDDAPLFGSVYTFKISRIYKPLNSFLKDEKVAVVRSVVIGFYN